MTKDQQIAELQRLLKVAAYEQYYLQQRLDALRSLKDQIIHLLEIPTFPEALEAAGPDATVFDLMGKL